MESSIGNVVMNGGHGPNSYTHNSITQGEAIERSNVLLIKSIQEKLTIDEHNSKQVFTIADFGCSVGPNTFTCVTSIIEAVKTKFKTQIPQFLVFFNDQVENDFNTLFRALPSDRDYMAAGVPGSFHSRLFPDASINLMYSSSSIHWLSKVPEPVADMDSPAWNRGRVTYVQSSSEVVEAYTAQFLSDIKAFFGARSEEMVKGGLLVIYMLSHPDGSPPSHSKFMQKIEYCLGQSLVDMANEGIVSEALVDSFNLPIYMPNISEVKQVVSGIKNLSIEGTGEVCFSECLNSIDDARTCGRNIRAALEGMLQRHFGAELVVGEVFERYAQKLYKLSKMPQFSSIGNQDFIFVLVKCNAI